MGENLEYPKWGRSGCADIGALLPGHSAGNPDFLLVDVVGDPLY